MLFNSQIFILLFLPLTLVGWNVFNRIKKYNLASLFLVGMSLWFYGYNNPKYLLLILASILFNYLISYLIFKVNNLKKVWFLVGLFFNLGLLAYYKYYDFFVENLNVFLKNDLALKGIILPLGISFFTLQQVSFVIDRYQNEAEHYGFIEYAAYVSFFPQLVAGPIVLHSEFLPQFKDENRRKFDITSFTDGIILFVLGLSKKVLLADSLAYFVNYGYDRVYWIDTMGAWLVALLYTFELYFDFSGYSDMAIGLGRMFNIEIPQNFNSPYKALSVGDFWKRWHMTLTRFFTKYVYIPLGGNRKKTAGVIVNIIIVYLVSGIWHGAGWTFVIWGLMHAIASVISRQVHKKYPPGKISGVITFLFVVTAWAVFRAEDTDVMLRMLKAMYLPNYSGFALDIASAVTLLPEFYVINKLAEMKMPSLLLPMYVTATSILLLISFRFSLGNNSMEYLNKLKAKEYGSKAFLILSILFVYCLISLSQVSTFLYFNF